MTTAQTTDSQQVQTVNSSAESAYGQLMSTGNPMMLVAAALMAVMAMGHNMAQYLQGMTKEGMALYTQGEEYSNCSNFNELFHTALDFRKEGQSSLADSVILGTLDPDHEIPEQFHSLVRTSAEFGKEELSYYEAYTDDPTQSGAEETFVDGFKEEWDQTAGYAKADYQSYISSDDGEEAYESAYALAGIEENMGQQILQMVQSFLGGFQTMEDAFLSISQSVNPDQGMNN